jgi:hypothetical protein
MWTLSTATSGGIITTLYALYVQLHFAGVSPTAYWEPWALPKKAFLLHQALLPQLVLVLALWVPLERKLAAAAFLPPLFASHWQLLGCGSWSPGASYAIGTYVCFIAFKTLEVLVFRDAKGGTFRRYGAAGGERVKARAMKFGVERTVKSGEEEEKEVEEVEVGEAYPPSLGCRLGWCWELLLGMRGVGWSTCVPIPPSNTSNKWRWVAVRVFRGAALWTWIDFLVYVMRTLDRPYWIPAGHATGFLPAEGGLPFPGLFSPSTKSMLNYPPPLGFPPLPEEQNLRLAYQVSLHALRMVLAASAIFSSISGAYTAHALFFVMLGAVLFDQPLKPGWQSRWLTPEAWPDTFGHIFRGDFRWGVRGFWSRGWHGLFRNVFTAPADFLIEQLQLGPKRAPAMLLKLCVPFMMSAMLHFAGAWTQSYGGFGAARFFLLQPFGIALEMAVARGWRKLKPQKAGKGLDIVEMVIPYVWALLWLVGTSSTLFEEYRQGGLWTVEPVPGSFSRWLQGEMFWVWTTEQRGWWRWATAKEGGVFGEWAVVVV